MFPIKLVCQGVTHLAAIITLVKAKFCLFVLRLNVPVNNFQSCRDRATVLSGSKVSCSRTQHG